MTTMHRLTRFRCAILVCVVLILPRPVSVCRGDESDSVPASEPAGTVLSADEWLAAMDMIALQMRANYELIRTCHGTCRFTDRMWFPGTAPRQPSGGRVIPPSAEKDGTIQVDRGAIPQEKGEWYWEISSGVATFSLDSARESYHVFYNPTVPMTFIDCKAGEVFQWNSNGDSLHWVVTPESTLEFDIRHREGQLPGFPNVASVDPTHGGRIAYKRDPEYLSHNTRFLDVRDFFRSIGAMNWEHCDRCARTLRGEFGSEYQDRMLANSRLYKRSSVETEYTLLLRYKNDIESETVFSGAAGFNPVSFVQRRKGQILSEQHVSYRNVSGVFFPVSFELTRYNPRSGSFGLIFHRSCTVDAVELGGKIDDAEFGVEQFQLEYGERLLDERTGALSVVDRDGQLTPADRFQFDSTLVKRPEQRDPTGSTESTPEAPTPARGSRWLLVANGLLVLALVAIFVVRRRIRSRK
jgi:hypothetical protein